MKIFIYTFASVILSSLSVTAQDSNMIRDMLTKTESRIPENYRDPLSIVEMRSSLDKVESFVQMQGILKSSWKTSLPLINELAANDTQKALYFKAAQILPREEYIAFVTAASEQAATGTISKQQFKWALFPGQKHLREMWTEDPPDESLQQLARRAKEVLGDDAGPSNFFDHVLSGKVASDNRSPEQTSPLENEAEGRASTPTTIPIASAPTTISSASAPTPVRKASSALQAEPPKSTPWSWIVGAILLLTVAGGVLFKFRRK